MVAERLVEHAVGDEDRQLVGADVGELQDSTDLGVHEVEEDLSDQTVRIVADLE